jgi:hypothetical protein
MNAQKKIDHKISDNAKVVAMYPQGGDVQMKIAA